MASAGDVPTLEVLAAVKLLRAQFPDLKIRMVNVVDLMALAPPNTHPHGMTDAVFDALFTLDKPVIFAYHGYPALIHRLTYRRANHDNFHVHGFAEEGTTTTPFDMVVLNRTDRFRLALAVVERVPSLASHRADARRAVERKLDAHRAYIDQHGIDLPDILNWTWAA
jgi:xylulose-5-phosphate/fructose-6-phosphate phosphoketolase